MLLAFPVQIDDDLRRVFVTRLRRAIELAGLTEQQACSEMLLKQSQWAEQCSGEGHISFTRLALLPTAVHCWFGLLLLIDHGLPVEVQTFLSLFTTTPPPVKMLAADPVQTERKRA